MLGSTHVPVVVKLAYRVPSAGGNQQQRFLYSSKSENFILVVRYSTQHFAYVWFEALVFMFVVSLRLCLLALVFRVRIACSFLIPILRWDSEGGKSTLQGFRIRQISDVHNWL
ncbi:hypothetical protein CPB83DRAFT_864707 [Crepidotus variabilis]|uniref:Uncharacterized protein n=1 Tax=Crepidotus variabilis TaxID=179855 RepID=A0A9P6E484_9AGAR|nr:hypothetical protein CPB83DRAFT_864707 [Crepidotus variabilis]